jgi:hypothetical protein
MDNSQTDRIAAGVFSNVSHADQAVRNLLNAGFTTEQITVICSDEARQRHFRAFEQEKRLEDTAVGDPLKGGLIGGALGGLVSLAGIVATGGVGIVAVGPLLGGGIAGSLLGLLAGQGVENEKARFYDQAVAKGQILVAVEDKTDLSDTRLAQAEALLAKAGAEPIELHEAPTT